MTTTPRAAFAACLFAAIVAGTLAPGFADAHSQLTILERSPSFYDRIHPPEAPRNLRVSYRPQVAIPGIRGGPGPSVFVSWDPGHYHAENTTQPPIYQIYLLKSPAGTTSPVYDQSGPDPEGPWGRCSEGSNRALVGCVGWTAGSDTAATVPGVEPETTYYVYVNLDYNRHGPRHYATATITTSSDTETPTEPEAPTEPETPGTVATPGCSYEHRIVGVPGTTSGGYVGRVWISSKIPNATASIRAYQGDNGHALDVLDSAGHAIGSVVSLNPANSIQRFQTETAQGWHVVTITHPTARAMHAASVVLRVRGPEGIQIVPIPPAEHCEPTSTAE